MTSPVGIKVAPTCGSAKVGSCERISSELAARGDVRSLIGQDGGAAFYFGR